MVCKTQGSMVSMLYRLGWLVRKLSMEETLSPSKKNCVVISLPSLFTQVRRQPFSMKYIVLEIFPSCNRMVLAGASTCLKKGEKMFQGILFFVFCFTVRYRFWICG